MGHIIWPIRYGPFRIQHLAHHFVYRVPFVYKLLVFSPLLSDGGIHQILYYSFETIILLFNPIHIFYKLRLYFIFHIKIVFYLILDFTNVEKSTILFRSIWETEVFKIEIMLFQGFHYRTQIWLPSSKSSDLNKYRLM